MNQSENVWQPIETAPKDGTMLLLCVAGCALPAIGQWVLTPRGGKWVAADIEDFDSMDDWAEHVGTHDFPATNWMSLPLPPPPSSQKTE